VVSAQFLSHVDLVVVAPVVAEVCVPQPSLDHEADILLDPDGDLVVRDDAEADPVDTLLPGETDDAPSHCGPKPDVVVVLVQVR